MPDVSDEEGQAFDICEYANACDPGLYCAEPELGLECDPQDSGSRSATSPCPTAPR